MLGKQVSKRVHALSPSLRDLGQVFSFLEASIYSSLKGANDHIYLLSCCKDQRSVEKELAQYPMVTPP